ncbi:alpha/beta hydrolase [Uliginosibacterium sp. H3]|uniref:Alpha/beta hydrolase n=1 Tax=Uliginosibacterium silvisoli TaxID=3114758 RepID=A0ABU6K3Q1_9RHOO|nr:alpha/beta hydrolase [Uliginosibacterium sp. H3]
MKFALRHADIRIQAERVWLDALLSHAPDVRGLIIQAAPYISQLSESRENHAARRLREAGFGTLVVSMLTPYEESRDPDVRYDVSLLTRRLQALLTWIDQQPQLTGLPVGLLAIGTVAAAGVRHIAREPERISAMTIRGGRADLAGGEPLRRLSIPTLVLVPGSEPELLGPNQQAYALMGSQVKGWQEIPGASADLIEPGTLDFAAKAASEWFSAHVPEPKPAEETPAIDDTNTPPAAD